MNRWFRHFFAGRVAPVISVAPDTQSAQGLWPLVVRVFHWVKVKYQESVQRRHEWEVYNSLNDHQLRDVGLSRDDIDLLLYGKKLVFPRQKPEQYQSPQIVKPGSLLRDNKFEKPSPSFCSTVSGNDCGCKAA